MSSQRDAFVVIPFKPKFDEIYEDVIKPVCEDIGYNVEKADSTNAQQNILKNIIKGIAEADLLIADLTDSNPNVFYEVGVAHALGIPTVLMTQDIDSIPFDLRPYAMNEYSRDFSDVRDLREELESIAEDHLDGGVDFGSPVSDFTEIDIALPTPENGDGQATEAEQTDKTDEPSSEPDKGVLDYAIEAEEEQTKFINSVSTIVEEMDTLQAQLAERTERITNMTESQSDPSAKQANRLIKRAANDIREFINSTSDDAEFMERSMGIMMDAEESFIDFADPDVADHREELRSRRENLKEFRSSVQKATEGLESFQYEATQIRGLNRELTQAGDNLASTLSDIISTLTSTDARAQRMLQLIDEKLEN